MPLKISNIRLPVEEPEDGLPRHLASHLHIPEEQIVQWRILRKSLDARSRRNLQFVYSAVIDIADEEDLVALLGSVGDVTRYVPSCFDEPEVGTVPLAERPVVVGSGPAGLLAAYHLAQRGYRPLIVERGQPVKARVPAIRGFDGGGSFDPENNYLFGEGGAGTFSDGKLTCRLSGPDIDWVLERMIECGADPSVRYEHRPHLGSNRLPLIVRNLRRQIEAMGGEYRFGCCLEGLETESGRIMGILTSGGPIKTNLVILAIGHSARDTYQMLYDMGVPMQAKPFQLGLRIEQPQEQINRHAYGRPEYLGLLGAADYTLVARGQKSVCTFCMCSGGRVIPSVSEPGMFCTNGMSNSRRDGEFANSGLVATVEPEELESSHPLAGVELQRQYEAIAFDLAGGDYRAPIQLAMDFIEGRTPQRDVELASSYERGTTPVDLGQVLPPSIAHALRLGLPIMDRKWKGDFLRDATLVGPEMRGSSPVRILRDSESRQSEAWPGLYPVGEGAGYAGGIVSAAVDGLRTAKAIVQEYAPL